MEHRADQAQRRNATGLLRRTHAPIVPTPLTPPPREVTLAPREHPEVQMHPVLRAATAAIVVLAAAAPALALELGDEAPELEVTKWIHGEAVTLADNPDKRIRVLQFWNTVDRNCIETVKTLNELQDELGEKGLDIIGITTQGPTSVGDFVKDNEVKYRLAVDEYDNTNAVYMKGIRKLPYAFVVAPDGRIAWQGDPRTGMKRVIEKIIGGTYDLEAAVKLQGLEKALGQALRPPMDLDKWAKAADDLLAVDAGHENALNIRIAVFQRNDDPDAYKTWVAAHIAKIQDDADTLNNLAWRLITNGNRDWCDPAASHAAAKRAVEVSKGEEADHVDTYARVLFEIGMLKEAVAEQKKAVKIDEESKSLKRTLRHYEACLKLRDELANSGGKKKRR